MVSILFFCGLNRRVNCFLGLALLYFFIVAIVQEFFVSQGDEKGKRGRGMSPPNASAHEPNRSKTGPTNNGPGCSRSPCGPDTPKAGRIAFPKRLVAVSIIGNIGICAAAIEN